MFIIEKFWTQIEKEPDFQKCPWIFIIIWPVPLGTTSSDHSPACKPSHNEAEKLVPSNSCL